MRPAGALPAVAFRIPGRVRLEVPSLRGRDDRAAALAASLGSLPWIRSAEASTRTARVLVCFDPTVPLQAVRRAVADSVGRQAREHRAPHLPSTRAALRRALAQGASAEALAEERRAERDLAVSIASFGVANAALAVPALAPLCLAGFLYVTRQVYVEAFQAARRGRATVSTLIAVAAAGGVLRGHFWILNYAGVVFRLSRRLLLAVQDRSRHALVDVFRAHPATVRVASGGGEVERPFASLRAGDVLAIRHGELIPADGRVVDGTAAVDEHVLTGESEPVGKGPGDAVLALTSVLSGRLRVEVEATGAATVVGRIGDELNRTAAQKTLAELRAETLAQRTVVPTLAAAAGALPFVGLHGALGVVNAHFRHKLSAVAPVALLDYLERAARRGIFVRDGRTLERLHEVDTVVFDKTGTLTARQPDVGRVHCCAGFRADEVLAYAAAAERGQAHPFAHAVRQECARRGLAEMRPDGAAEPEAGYGLTALVAGRAVLVGSLRFAEQRVGIAVPASIRRAWNGCRRRGSSLFVLAVDGRMAGAVELLPALRPEVPDLVQALRRRPAIRTLVVLSGDHESATRAIAERVGADRHHADALPEAKARIVDDLQAAGARVCYVGDGVNDLVALKTSLVSVTLRGGSEAAADSADVVLMDGGLSRLDDLFQLAEGLSRRMRSAFGAVLAPSAAGMAGALFMRFGLVQTVLLGELGLAGGLLCAAAPWDGEPAEGPDRASSAARPARAARTT